MEAEVTIRRQGNSVGVVLPQAILRQMGFSVGQTVSMLATPDGLLIKAKRTRYTAAELNAQCDPNATMPDDLLDWEAAPRIGSELL